METMALPFKTGHRNSTEPSGTGATSAHTCVRYVIEREKEKRKRLLSIDQMLISILNLIYLLSKL